MPDDIVVTVEEGKIRGKVQEDYNGGKFYSFSGIPYAKAPVAELRFKAPLPAEPWTGIKDGTKEGPECPSTDMIFKFYLGKEDNCLNLNVYTKELSTEKEKGNPVMVFIHGGAFTKGSNKSVFHGPHYLMTEDIVLVVINYRLGVLGFLSLDDPSLEVPGNAGMKDQVMALKWVQKNIHNFGGDPSNVTIFGNSAGAASVHYLTLSPLSKGLFHKAIMQSGSAIVPWARGKRNALDIAKQMGYDDTSEKAILHKLREANAKSITAAQFKDDHFDACEIRPYGPVIEYPHEGAFLTEDPEEIMKSGRSHQIPIIMGYTSLEGLLYGFFQKVTGRYDWRGVERDVPYDLNIPPDSHLKEEVVQKLKKFYFDGAEPTEENKEKKFLLFGDISFVYGLHKTARLLLRHGSAPVYMYRMSLESPLNITKKLCLVKYFKTFIFITFLHKLTGLFRSVSDKLSATSVRGAAHGDEVIHLFSNGLTPTVTRGSEEEKSIKKFVKPWTSFAKYGVPICGDEDLDDVTWKPLESEELENILDIGETYTAGNLDGERMEFWGNIYQEYSN
ncbi:hypothetical protein JTB14_012481 [Gonioctena quinquepunctata]|nr:hypothetical protein JTB14_012481 [Gonioctena quinquepunctata]